MIAFGLDLTTICTHMVLISILPLKVGNITNGEYNLQINNVTEKDEGIYECFRYAKNNKPHKVTVVTLTIRGNYYK